MLFRRKMFKGISSYKVWRKIIATILIFSLLFIFNAVDNTIGHIVTEITIKNAEETINHVVNDTVNNIIIGNDVSYSTFINLNDNDSNVSSVVANTDNINKFKAEVIVKTENALKEYKSLKTVVQLGSLTSSAILSNRGPDRPIYFDFYCAVNANIANNFSSAGINQTNHSIKLVVSVEYCIIFNDDEYKSSITTDYIIGENVIVGNTPNIYGNLLGLTSEKED